MKKIINTWHKPILFILMVVQAAISAAGELPSPTGEVILTVTGNIENHNATDSDGEKILQLDLAMLEALEPVKITTNTPWTEGVTAFEGVRIDELLEYVGAGSSSFDAFALDDYHGFVDDVDFKRYPVVLAYKLNDEYMKVRDLGPLWLMFPLDDFPELNSEKIKSLCIWQLITVAVH